MIYANVFYTAEWERKQMLIHTHMNFHIHMNAQLYVCLYVCVCVCFSCVYMCLCMREWGRGSHILLDKQNVLLFAPLFLVNLSCFRMQTFFSQCCFCCENWTKIVWKSFITQSQDDWRTCDLHLWSSTQYIPVPSSRSCIMYRTVSVIEIYHGCGRAFPFVCVCVFFKIFCCFYNTCNWNV